MLAFAHTIISLPFGVYLNNPLLILGSTFLMHLFCDTLLHWNIYPTNFKRFPFYLVAIDLFGGFGIAWFLTGSQFLTYPILLAILGGNLPDIIQGTWEVFLSDKQRQQLHRFRHFFVFHDHLQYETASISKGLILQITLVIIAIIIL